MHVLRLTPHFYWPHLEDQGWPVPFDTIGGMQSQIFRQIFELSRMGIRQTVLTLKIPGAPTEWQVDPRTIVRGIRLPILPVRSRIRGLMDLNISWALGIANEFLQRRLQGDIVHVHCSGVFWPLLVGAVFAKAIKARLILTIHCSVLATYEAMNLLDHAIQPMARLIELMAVQRADHIIVLSSRSREALKKLAQVNDNKVSVVPDSIEVDRFRSYATPQAMTAFKHRYRIPTDRPIIAYVGRIAREKGWRRIIALAERLRGDNCHFLICGDGNERDLLERELKKRGLISMVTVTGYIAQEVVPAALSYATVLVLTSLHEEFGGILIEAMSMKVPQVAFNVGGIPNVIVDRETGILVPPDNIETMALAVRELIRSPTLVREMGEKSLVHVKQKFSLKEACQQLYNIYQS
ncbi:MAG: glycosyltransferase family 4 protein [Acidobacteria bacterium]|nr:glycosyltransferase family 4 protein [Acidobacteriota bacterium]